MLNILSLLGPSRCGKSAMIPLLPFNTPDLDWYVDAYNCGDLSSEALCRLSASYLLCYSWYGNLGRHINLRSTDYYSLQNMMPRINLLDKHDKVDDDQEFENYLKSNDLGELWNIFLWELPPKIYEKIEKSFPINTNPIYCYRSPYYLFTSWISSNRIKRSKSLSRMFKYPSTKHLQRIDLFKQFAETRNHNLVNEAIWSKGKYTYFEFQFDNVTIDEEEESKLFQLVKENKENSLFWSQKDMMFPYEIIVTEPDKFVNYLKDRFKVEFDNNLLEKGIYMMDKRPLNKVIELDIKKVEDTLNTLGCNEDIKQFVINEHINYINDL